MKVSRTGWYRNRDRIDALLLNKQVTVHSKNPFMVILNDEDTN
jgi:hypothetical protein